MAKEVVSPIERHLEKGVLALTVLLFVGVVVKYLVSSPNMMTVGTRAVGPTEIYQMVADEGTVLRESIRKAEVKVAAVSKPKLDGPELAVAALPSPVPFGPRVPRLQTEETGNIELVTVPPMGTPLVVVGRSGAVLAKPEPVTALPKQLDDYYKNWNKVVPEDQAYTAAVNWATVAATFEVEAQRQRAVENRYPPGRAVPYLIGVELQRRERHWDGTYGEWAPVKTYAPLVLPDLPVVELEEINGAMMVSEETLGKIRKFAQVVQHPDFRLELMRPMPPRIAYGEWWKSEAIKFPGLDLVRLDDEVWWGEELGNCPMINRYPKPRKEKSKSEETQDFVKIVDAELDELDKWMEQGCAEAVKMRYEALRRDDAQFNDKQRARREALGEKAAKLLAKKQKEEEERKKRGEPEPTRAISPIQVLWAHDAWSESVISGKIYQYRMRALLYNNYAGAAAELKNPRDAELVLLPGEWSGPSPDVSIPYDTEFWLAGKRDREQTAKVEVFKWYEGAWVRAVFEVAVGNPIGGKEFVKTSEKEKPRVDFSTGATVVDLDFNYPYRARKEHRGTIGLDDPKPTLAMVYFDSAGELRQRLLDEDKKDEKYKEMKEKVGKTGEPAPPKKP